MDANKFGPGTATKERIVNPEDAVDNASVHMSTVRDFHSLSRTNRTKENILKRRDSYRSKKYPPGTIVGKNGSDNSNNKRRPMYSGGNDMKLQTDTTERGRKFTFTKNTDL